jgi:diguanylate cyclase (GGDEF)-like protein
VRSLDWKQRASAAIGRAHGTSFLLLDGSMNVQWANETFHRIFGFDPVGVSALEFVHPDDVAFCLSVIHHQNLEVPVRSNTCDVETGEFVPASVQVRLRNAQGDWMPTTVSVENFLGQDDVDALLVRVDRTRDQSILGQSLQLLTAGEPIEKALLLLSDYCIQDRAASVAPANAILWWDSTGAHLVSNSMNAKDIGFLTHPSVYLDHMDSSDSTVAVEDLTNEPTKQCATALGLNSVWIVPIHSDEGKPLGVVLTWASFREARTLLPAMSLTVGSQIVKLALAENLRRDRLEAAALIDTLTQVQNRAGFVATLNALRDRQQFPVGALFLDLDDFKLVNDRFGHAIGDIVLAEVGARLAFHCRSTDVVARLGGDEFVLLTSGSAFNELYRVADRILDAMKIPVQAGDLEVPVTVSIGISCATDANSLEGLLERADQALYEVKRTGKGAASKASK